MYKVGDRIELVLMHDIYPIKVGTKGTIVDVQGDTCAKTGKDYIIEVDWDDGRKLNIITVTDKIKRVTKRVTK